jgi:hypothetical protein
LHGDCASRESLIILYKRSAGTRACGSRAQVIGRGGLNIVDHWADGPRTFAGIYSVNFPNMFVLVGPQAPAIITNVTQVGSPTARPSAADPEAP